MYKIYKIVDNTNSNIYVGITEKTLKSRLSKHISNYKTTKGITSREIIKNGNFKIELIETTDDSTRERYWIENLKCVNNNVPGRTIKEYDEQRKVSRSQYYLDNKELRAEYYLNNIEHIKKTKKQRNDFQTSFGGDKRYNNNLLLIDVDIFD